jgi:hypothetical protein
MFAVQTGGLLIAAKPAGNTAKNLAQIPSQQ